MKARLPAQALRHVLARQMCFLCQLGSNRRALIMHMIQTQLLYNEMRGPWHAYVDRDGLAFNAAAEAPLSRSLLRRLISDSLASETGRPLFC